MLKISSFLMALVLCQMCDSSAAPVRPAADWLSDRFAVLDFDARRLLSSVMRSVLPNGSVMRSVLPTTEDLEPDSSRGRLWKRCSSLSTCVLGKLSQELHKLQSRPQTDVGSATPGRKRSLADGPQDI